MYKAACHGILERPLFYLTQSKANNTLDGNLFQLSGPERSFVQDRLTLYNVHRMQRNAAHLTISFDQTITSVQRCTAHAEHEIKLSDHPSRTLVSFDGRVAPALTCCLLREGGVFSSFRPFQFAVELRPHASGDSVRVLSLGFTSSIQTPLPRKNRNHT